LHPDDSFDLDAVITSSDDFFSRAEPIAHVVILIARLVKNA
jgi:hypothetical protein